MLVVVVALCAPAAAGAQPSVIGPWGGENPFNCELQNVGTGTDYPHPEADPFCVEFDKTNQNVTDFGLVDFLSQEPARTAAAAPKCFYFQRDHWTGSIVQGSGPELWHWDGNYFFDKAKGIGGVNVANFRVAGVPMDPGPFAPDAMKPYLSPGGGGAIVLLETDPDPQCTAMVDTPAERQQVYGGSPQFPSCLPPRGKLGRGGAAGARLGRKRQDLIARLGKPQKTKRGVDRWCVIGDAQLRVAYARHAKAKRGPRRAALVRTTSRGHTRHGVGVGTRAGKAKRKLSLEPYFRIRRTKVLAGPAGGGPRLFAGVRRHRVRWLALASLRLLRSARTVKGALRRAN